jgi:acetyl esterase/lipase
MTLVTVLCASIFGTSAGVGREVKGPVDFVYAVRDTIELHAFVFTPSGEQKEQRSAILVFHGGGWHIGSATWAFSTARHFAELGMVSVAAQYRLSDQRTVTPLDAMADARDVIRWVRANAATLGIAKDRVAAYGWSAGAHLAASAAIFGEASSDTSESCIPDALILFSAAVSLEGDRWVQRLLGEHGVAAEISPDNFVRRGLPPTIILQGRTDTVTPLVGVERFCNRMREAGNRCDLFVYDGVGHLFTPSSEPDNGMPNPDPEIEATADREADKFLLSLGFIKNLKN